jgi:hypothetical protein
MVSSSKRLAWFGADMKTFASIFALFVLFAPVSPVFAGQRSAPVSDVPGWSVSFNDQAVITYYNCEMAKKCGEGSIVSLSVRPLPAPTNSELRSKYKNQNLPIKCRTTKRHKSCGFPAAIDKNGKPTHYRPIEAPGFTADYFHIGYISRIEPVGSRYNTLITIVSSGETYEIAKRNYDLFYSMIVTPPQAR